MHTAFFTPPIVGFARSQHSRTPFPVFRPSTPEGPADQRALEHRGEAAPPTPRAYVVSTHCDRDRLTVTRARDVDTHLCLHPVRVVAGDPKMRARAGAGASRRAGWRAAVISG